MTPDTPDTLDRWRLLFCLFGLTPDQVEAVAIPNAVSRVIEKFDDGFRLMAYRHTGETGVEAIVEAYTQTVGGTVYLPTIAGDTSSAALAPFPLRTQQDLILAALVVVIVCLTWICLTAVPFPQSLIEPLAVATGFLWGRYEHLNRRP